MKINLQNCNHCKELFPEEDLINNDGMYYCKDCVDSFIDYIDRDEMLGIVIREGMAEAREE